MVALRDRSDARSGFALSRGRAASSTARPSCSTGCRARISGSAAQSSPSGPTSPANWKGDLGEAERLSTEALDLYRRNGEPFLIADALNNLAVIKMHRGKLDEAIALYEEAIALTREVYGERHPHVAVRLENLGNVYMRQGEFDKTNALLDEVLAIRESAYGKDSAPAARTRFNMGVVASRSGRLRARLELIGSALDVFRKQSGRAEPRLRDRAVRPRPRRRRSRRSRQRAQPLSKRRSRSRTRLAAPTAELRLRTLDSLAKLRCELGSRRRERDRRPSSRWRRSTAATRTTRSGSRASRAAAREVPRT